MTQTADDAADLVLALEHQPEPRLEHLCVLVRAAAGRLDARLARLAQHAQLAVAEQAALARLQQRGRVVRSVQPQRDHSAPPSPNAKDQRLAALGSVIIYDDARESFASCG